MKKLVLVLGVLATFMSVDSWALRLRPLPGHEDAGRKVLLGETFLSNRLDGDYIRLNNACNLTAFQIGVRGDAAEIYDLKVVFGNGDVQDIAVREHFMPGSDSRFIDLEGDTRCIQGVYVYGRSRSITPQQTRVVLFGVKAEQEFGRGVLLGRTALMNRRDADLIDLPRPVCGLKEFKIAVRGDDARIDYLMVQFANGERQNIQVRDFFREGSSSNWKDLDGRRRCIDKIFVVGQSAGRDRRQSIVEFYGKF